MLNSPPGDPSRGVLSRKVYPVAKTNIVQLCLVALCFFSSLACGPVRATPPRGGETIQGVRTMDVEFAGSDGFTLRGTLTSPQSGGPSPAILLIPGSGPTDRNGNQPPALVTDLLKQLADVLTKSGFTTLRFDKRATHVYAAVWPKISTGKIGSSHGRSLQRMLQRPFSIYVHGLG